MKKTIDGKDYYLPSNLTPEQEEIYCHIIDWKRANITKERGVYKGNEYDALFPDNPEYPRMLYRAIVPELQECRRENSPSSSISLLSMPSAHRQPA